MIAAVVIGAAVAAGFAIDAIAKEVDGDGGGGTPDEEEDGET